MKILTDKVKLKLVIFVSQRRHRKNYLQYTYTKQDYTKNIDSSADQKAIRPMPEMEKCIKDLIMRMHLNGQ